MRPHVVSEETSGQQPCAATSCTRETLSCVATSMRSLQSLMEQGDFEEISDVFLRICMGEPPAQPRSKAGLTDPVHSSTVPMRMYFGVTRPSSASTAVPSSSLSLCSASMEPSAASDLPQEQGNMNVSTEYENEGRENSGLCRGTNGIGAKRLEGRREESEADASTCPGVPGVEGGRDTGTRCSNVAHDDDSSCAATPSKKEACFSASGEKTGGKSNTAGTAAAFLARRSPRLQKSQDTQRQEPLSSPASKRHYPTLQQQQPWGAPSRGSAAGRGRPHMRGGKRRQGTTVASLGPKRRREEAAAEEAPLSSRGGGGKAKQVNVDPGNEGGAISPPKSATSKRKGHCRGDAAKTAWAGKQARGAEDKGQKAWQRKKAKLREEEDRAEPEAHEGPSPAHSQDASEVDDEPICRFALPVLKEGGDAFDAPSGLVESCDRFVELSQASVAAVQREEACAEDKLRRDGGETPGKDEGPVGALQHKVLRALPEPTPQFDFGLFIVRAAAMSKHVDDIFPLLEDEELMERSVVLEKYLGPPKEGAKRRGDHFMLDKLVADIPNQGGVYRPFLDIKEAPWCTGLDSADGKVLPKKEVLRQRIEVQRKWNPFSIFGSSPPSVELEDVFGYEVYQRTAPSARVHHPLFRRLSQFQSFKDLYSSLSKEEWDRVSSAFRHHWNKQCRLDLDWTNDPLTVDEIMWMLEANEQVEDRSSHVYEAEICYCVTPNPNVGFGWNDPRCHRYKAPRPSMGCHILAQPPLVDGFLEDQDVATAAQEPSTREPSSLPDPADPLTSKSPSDVLGKQDEEEPANAKHETLDVAAGRYDATGTGGKQQPSMNTVPDPECPSLKQPRLQAFGAQRA